MCVDATFKVPNKVPVRWGSKKAREGKFSEFKGKCSDLKGSNARKSEAMKLEQDFFGQGKGDGNHLIETPRMPTIQQSTLSRDKRDRIRMRVQQTVKVGYVRWTVDRSSKDKSSVILKTK
jgi:hypothetical protein